MVIHADEDKFITVTIERNERWTTEAILVEKKTQLLSITLCLHFFKNNFENIIFSET